MNKAIIWYFENDETNTSKNGRHNVNSSSFSLIGATNTFYRTYHNFSHLGVPSPRSSDLVNIYSDIGLRKSVLWSKFCREDMLSSIGDPDKF